MEIRKVELQDIDTVMNLVSKVFMKFVSQEETKEGVERFLCSNTLDFYTKETITTYVAIQEKRIVGMISVDDKNHIHLLFVEEMVQRLGIGKLLLEKVMSFIKGDITVHSSLYAYHFYYAMGFCSTNVMQEKEGIRFIPMVKRKDV